MKLTKDVLKKMIIEAVQEEMGSSEKNLSTLFQDLQETIKGLDELVASEDYSAGNREIGKASDLISDMIRMLEEAKTTLDQVDPDSGGASNESMEKIINMVGISSARTTYQQPSYEEYQAKKKAGFYKK